MESLKHYGVKGMHWGVRRYQNYDGTRIKGKDFTIKKKTNVYRVTTNPNETLDNTRKYGTIDKKDTEVYKEWLNSTNDSEENENWEILDTYEAIQDLRVAGEETALKTLSKLHDVSLPKDWTKMDYEDIYDEWEKKGVSHPFDVSNERNSNDNLDPLISKRPQLSNRADEYSKMLIKKGYDAVVDMNDVNIANTPIIFLKPKDQLTKKEQEILLAPWWMDEEWK